MLSDRINEIINEATLQQTISKITWDERQELSKIYKDITGENINPSCNACIIRICYEIKNQLKTNNDGKRKRNKVIKQ